MTCVTCHEVHGGQRYYLFRRDTDDAVCVICHQGY
ncbi:MAG: cytochrome c3 family protein [Desulfovibrionaceae bacterium]